MKLASRAAAIFTAAVLCLAAGPPEIRLESGRFLVRGWLEAAQVPRERWGEMFAVFVDTAAAGSPQVLGSYALEGAALVFDPRFPLQPGMRYRAVLRTDPPVVARFEVPKAKPRPAPRIESVFPSGDRLPENQLKIYLHFSEPMARGEAYQHVRLLDERGDAVELPFLELDQELWDRAGKRLTLLFDPGRIKRGLVPNEEAGLALQAGRRYTFLVDGGWPGAGGASLGNEYRKEFAVVAPDRDPPRLQTWRVGSPAAGTTAPVVVDFPEPMDRALLEHMISVQDAEGHTVRGAAETEAHETRWRFTPAESWRAGTYALAVDTALEDLAGNRIDRPFDVDLFERVERRIVREIRSLPFEVGSSH